MKIGVVKEIKNNENRVSVTPEGVALLKSNRHSVMVEKGAGLGSGFADAEYERAGANLVSAAEAWDVDLVVKVKEPLKSEYHYLNGQMVFTFFHLAGVERQLTEVLLQKKVTALAYETLENGEGKLPLLAPMSAVAGNMATLMGSYYLAKFNQGKGMQLGKVLGKIYGKVVVIGDGTVGQHAAHVASSMGARVLLAGCDEAKGINLNKTILPHIEYFISGRESILKHIIDADLVVGAVLIRGAKAPKVITEEMVMEMTPGSVIVDVSIDQGGCIETSRPTTHSEPVFIKHGIVHYCVANMPGAYPRTSTIALADASLPYILDLANDGMDYVKIDEGVMKAVNTYKGYVTCKAVALELGFGPQYCPLSKLI